MRASSSRSSSKSPITSCRKSSALFNRHQFVRSTKKPLVYDKSKLVIRINQLFSFVFVLVLLISFHAWNISRISPRVFPVLASTASIKIFSSPAVDQPQTVVDQLLLSFLPPRYISISAMMRCLTAGNISPNGLVICYSGILVSDCEYKLALYLL
jgi:hypothetical protein